MVTKDLIKKIRQIEIKSNWIVEEIFSGEYSSAFRGRGMEFAEIREYYPGDDIRTIDWNVTARQNRVYVKKFEEERELNMFLLIDMSNSNKFAKKKRIIAELGATLAFSAVKNNDKVGSLLFTKRVEKFIPAKKGKKHVLSIIEDILRFKPQHPETDIKHTLQYFDKIAKKRSVVFIISDFLDEDYQQQLKIIAKKHDLVLIRVIDRAEEKIPQGAIFHFEDLETGEEIIIDSLKGEANLDLGIKLPKEDLITIYTDQDFIKPLMLFFKRRMKR